MKLFNKKDKIKEVETVVDEEGNVVEVEKKKPSFKEWVKNHKKGLAIGAVGLTALAAGIGMAVKNHKKNEAEEDEEDDLYYDEDDEDEDETEDDDSDEENESEESTED